MTTEIQTRMSKNEDSHEVKLYPILSPIAWVYKMVAWVRNRLFDWNILPSESFDVPVVSVGNITVGGTGKTPHTEYLVRLFSDASYRVAVLSRGYKRHTHGFRLVTMSSSSTEVGDEPLQIKRKFPTVMVAVDADRRRGIRRLMAQSPGLDVILLDDAYQHRYVTPAVSILLTNYRRMIYEDKMLPVGRLRESVAEKARANFVIVTKCPDDLKPIDYRLLSKHLDLYPYQNIYFTGLRYDRLEPVFPSDIEECVTVEQLHETQCDVLLVAGIASPALFVDYIHRYTDRAKLWSYGDHHEFSQREIRKMEEWLAATIDQGGRGVVIVTEKDAVRLLDNPKIPLLLKQHLYYLPLRVHFMLEQAQAFNAQVKDLVLRYRRSAIQGKK